MTILIKSGLPPEREGLYLNFVMIKILNFRASQSLCSKDLSKSKTSHGNIAAIRQTVKRKGTRTSKNASSSILRMSKKMGGCIYATTVATTDRVYRDVGGNFLC